MLIKGIVESENKRVFEKQGQTPKVLRQIVILEQFLNGRHALTPVQVWGENHVDTTPGVAIELEVRMTTDYFDRKDGSRGEKTKLVAVQ